MSKLLRTRSGGFGWLTPAGIEAVGDPIAALETGGPPAVDAVPPSDLARPLDPREIWCAGVTYERSRRAREAETQAPDVYALIYDADRPELFLKDAACRRTVGPGDAIGVREDSVWTVPEPELALVIGRSARILGATIGNDVTARDLEGANPLYLPQAKLFAGGCSIGPIILTRDEWPEHFDVSCRIIDAYERVLWEASTSTSEMRRSFEDLVGWLTDDNPIPPGTVLLTGTGLVPPDNVALVPGQRVEISITAIGTLVNPVRAASDLLPSERIPRGA